MAAFRRLVERGSAAPARMANRPSRVRSFVITMVVLLVALLVNLPLLNAVWTSIKSDADIGRSPLNLSIHPTLAHYASAMGAAGYDFPRFFLNSVLLALGAVILVVAIALPSTYAIMRLGFGGAWLLRATASLRLLPAIFFAIPLFLLFSNLGLYDTIPALILANTFLNLPLAMLIIAGGLRDLPIEIEEAARIDGCTAYRILLSIVTPLLAPAIVATSIITFMFSWADYLFAVILTSSNATPVTVGAANFVTSTGIQWGNISAATVLSALPPLIFAVFAQRFLVSGLSVGAIKG